MGFPSDSDDVTIAFPPASVMVSIEKAVPVSMTEAPAGACHTSGHGGHAGGYAEGSIDETAVFTDRDAAVSQPAGAVEAAAPSTRPNPPDVSLLFERMKDIACRMGLSAQLSEELISDLIFTWWSRGWHSVPFPAPEKLDAWVRRCLNRRMTTIQVENARRYRLARDYAHSADSRPCPLPGADLERQELRPLLLRLVAEEGTGRASRIVRLTLKGSSIEEIAHQVGKSSRTVRGELARVRKLLLPRLRELGF